MRGLTLTVGDQPGFWEGTATTTPATHGSSSATSETELAHRHPRRGDRRNPRRRPSSSTRPAGSVTAPGSIDVRLSAENGHQAHHSYSVASAPEDERLALTVERLPDGEVSPPGRRARGGRSAGAARADRRLLRMGAGAGRPGAAGPRRLGRGALARDAAPPRRRPQPRHDAAPVLRAVASRPRLRPGAQSPGRCRSRSRRPAHLHPTLARELERAPWTDRPRAARAHSPWTPAQRPLIYVCGPSGFVEAVANGLVDNGHLPEQSLESMARRVGHGGVTCPNWRVASSRPS